MSGKGIKMLTIILSIALILTGCTLTKQKREKALEKSGFVLGTIVTLKLTQGGSEELLETMFERLTQIENEMSTSVKGSDIYLINEKAGIESVEVSEDTLKVIRQSLEYTELSHGYFDVTLGPLIQLWKIGTPEAHIPENDEIIKALSYIDYKDILIDGNNVGLKRKNMKMDLGGIAKGYAADILYDMAIEAGVASGIINLGGNVHVIGSKDDNSLYKIGIQDPFSDRNDYLGVVEVKDKSVVTSGDYERFFEVDGKKYHHIFNKDTGYPADNGVAAVSVITQKSIDADALSTILFILGEERGIALVNSLDNVECIYITYDNNIHLSEGADEFFSLTKDTFTLVK
jgi:thiamine biosynthesis lipoprotein